MPDVKTIEFPYVKEVKLIAKHNGKKLKICKLTWSENDCSLYMFVYGKQGKFYYGNNTIQAQEESKIFDFTHQHAIDQIPKLSLHQSGQVHVGPTGSMAGPLSAIPFSQLRGEHIATVQIFDFKSLPEFEPELKRNVRKPHIFYPFVEELTAARILFYGSAGKPVFDFRCDLRLQMRRFSMTYNPFYIGIAALQQKALGPTQSVGALAMAGWRGTKDILQSDSFLYLKAE